MLGAEALLTQSFQIAALGEASQSHRFDSFDHSASYEEVCYLKER